MALEPVPSIPPLVVVAHDDPGLADSLRHAVETAAGWQVVVANPTPAGIATALAAGPSVALVACPLLADLPAGCRTPVMAIGDDDRPADIRAAFAAGARSLLAWPDGAADLLDELARVAATGHAAGAGDVSGLVVATRGVQGGAGTTTVAAHLAAAWARWGPTPVLLVDLAGGLAFRLDLGAAPTWSSFAPVTGTPPDGASPSAPASGVRPDTEDVTDEPLEGTQPPSRTQVGLYRSGRALHDAAVVGDDPPQVAAGGSGVEAAPRDQASGTPRTGTRPSGAASAGTAATTRPDGNPWADEEPAVKLNGGAWAGGGSGMEPDGEAWLEGAPVSDLTGGAWAAGVPVSELGARTWGRGERSLSQDPRVLARTVAEPWTGLSVLPLAGLVDGVPDPPPAPWVVQDVLEAARATYRLVVIDLPATDAPAVRTALAQADVLLAVGRCETAGVRGLHAALAGWTAAGHDPETAGAVVTGVRPQASLAPREVRAALGDRLWGLIPAAAPELAAAAEDGVLLLDRHDLPAVQAMLTLANQVVPYEAISS